DVTFTIKVTSGNTFNATLTRGTSSYSAYDLPMINGGLISSFGLYAVNSANDAYWKNGALSDTGTVELGSGNGDSAIGGVIADGLAANSTTTVRANSVIKSGTGTITLNNTN